MTAGKNRFILYLLIFLISTERFYASSKNVTSLSLDFKRTETSSSSSGVMAGKIVYNKNPFYFVFQTFTPEKQTIYENEQGAWLLQGDTIIDISEQKDSLNQICKDFLNWFKEDYGLTESGFKPSLMWLENQTLMSQWDKNPDIPQPIDHVIVYSDSLGRLTDLKMYLDQNELFTATTLSDFKYSAGHYYPSIISSVSYEEAVPLVTTQLSFSNVNFSFYGTDKNTLQYAAAQIIELEPAADLSGSPHFETVLPASPTVYRVSIPSVLVNVSFKFYKKFITNQDMSACPFYPSCSQYMLQAVSQNGIAGFIQGLERLKRCTSAEHKRDLYPVTQNGRHYDPVPSKK